MNIYRYRVYRSPNIGVYMRTNDNYLFIPYGLARSKAERLERLLGVKSIMVSIAYTRLLGPLMVLNNNGILLPSIVEDHEVENLKRLTCMKVNRLDTKFTALGNLIATNDRSAIVSPLLKDKVDDIGSTLNVKTVVMSIALYNQVGALIACTDKGAVIHPGVSDEDISRIGSALGVNVEPATVNGGVPFVSSGIVMNNKAIVVGSSTTGPELVMLSRAFQ